MEVTKELIRKFLENNCTEEEAAAVRYYIRSAGTLPDDWLNEEEWEAFQTQEIISEGQSENWYRYISEHKEEQKGRVISARGWFRVAAVAAVILIVSVIVLQQWPKPAAGPAVIVAEKEEKSMPVKEKTISNHTANTKVYTLSDSSSVLLYAHSEIVLQQPFPADKREIRLRGEATFHVAKDAGRPFTVYTENFSTTALGTVFRIKALPGSNESNVKLLHGKVVVKTLKTPSAPVYMEPGDVCSFSNNQHRLLLNGAKVVVPVLPASPASPAAAVEKEAMNFSNTPLEEVFKQISQTYHTKIDTDSVVLKGRKFTGTFSKDQPVSEILETIAELNNFAVIRDSTAIRLKAQ